MSINAESRFYLTRGIMTLEETKKLNNDRELLDFSLLIGETTDDQLYEQIKVEMDLFHKCLEIMKAGNQNDKHTKLLLLMLFDRINNMYTYMFFLFPINAERTLEYIQFCLNHLSIIFPHKYE